MIQIIGGNQFRNAAARLQRERMKVKRHEAGRYDVTNTAKNHNYLVSFTKINERVFGTCTCEAGMPMKGNRVPIVCKHLAAAVIFHNAINAARRAAKAAPAPVPVFRDDDPDAMEANW